MSGHADTIRGDDDPWELLTIQTHALEEEEDKNTALLAENQRYEKVLERIEATPTKANDPLVLHKLEQIKDIARAALAGEDG